MNRQASPDLEQRIAGHDDKSIRTLQAIRERMGRPEKVRQPGGFRVEEAGPACRGRSPRGGSG